MASTYNGNMFFGFSACLPQGVLPDWFYYPVFCPSGPADEDGIGRQWAEGTLRGTWCVGGGGGLISVAADAGRLDARQVEA